MERVLKNKTNTNILDLISNDTVHQKDKYNQQNSSLIKPDYKLDYLKYELSDIKVDYFDVKKCATNTHLTEYRNDSLDMIFFISGTLQIMFQDNSELIFPNRHNLCYTAPGLVATEWKLDSINLQVLTISLPKEIFSQYPSCKTEPIRHFLQRMDTGKSARLHPHCMPISKEMNTILSEIIHCKKENHTKWMFLESKVKELLVLQIEQSYNGLSEDNSNYRPHSISKINKTKSYMEQNLSARLSLSELAKKVGTNTFTLKKGFKEIYGSTIFNFWNDLRMQKARLLLKNDELLIGEISEQLGFKSQHHFSTTFKKKFGMTPSQAKTP